MADEKVKMLNYRRANFLENSEVTLEEHLITAHQRLPNIEDRTVNDGAAYPVLECRNFNHKPGIGVFLHIAAYTPGEQASVVPRVTGVSAGEISTVDPPENCEFMDGDTMALVVKNHVILCTSNLHESHAERYMSRIIEAARIGHNAEHFSLEKVANVNKITLIRSQGVKSISLNASLYGATLDYTERTTVSRVLGGGIGDQLKALLENDHTPLDLEEAENLSVRIILSFDQRKTGAAFGRENLEVLADRMIREDDDSYTINTLGGEKIGPNDILLRKKISLPKFGKTVYCKAAWQELENYFLELQSGGLLEQ